MAEYIEREAAKKKHCEICWEKCICYRSKPTCDELKAFDLIPAADVRPVPEGGIGEMSDGYHTFNGLYYQRLILFAALVKAYRDKAWKSHRHEDGELCFGGGWFIVGIETPEGSYTYHYEDKDWDRFDCEELPTAKHWDGHNEEDVTRLLSLPDVRPVARGKWEQADAIDELRDALLLMVLQYCTTDDGLLYHSFMSAGENAFAVLGLENGQQADPLWNRVLVQKPPKEG